MRKQMGTEKIIACSLNCYMFNGLFQKGNVKLQFPYELSFLSVFWITSKSNQKYRLDVVNEVFNRSQSRRDRRPPGRSRDPRQRLGPRGNRDTRDRESTYSLKDRGSEFSRWP